MKRLLTIIITILLLNFMIILMPMCVNASANENKQLEVVILLDVSSSMGVMNSTNGSDPEIIIEGIRTRVSTEAIKAFIWNCPFYVDMWISIVAYNGDIIISTPSINVNHRTNGAEEIAGEGGYIEQILNNRIAWNISNGTHIQKALEEAEGILRESKFERRAVLLLTDGAIEGVSDIETSKKKCVDIVRNFSRENIEFYAIGLQGGDRFDGKLLQDLSRIHGRDFHSVNLNEGDRIQKVINHFNSIYADLVGAYPNRDPEHFPIEPNVLHSYPVYVLGEITREVNVVLVANSKLKDIAVFDANGKDVTNTERVRINPSGLLTHVKFISPQVDGEWEIKFMGTENDMADVTQIHLYDVSLRYSENESEVYLYNNDTQQRVTSSRIYEDESILHNFKLLSQNDYKFDVSTKINEKSDGYKIDFYNMDIPSGEYTLRLRVDKEGYFSFSHDISGIIIPPPPSPTQTTTTEETISSEIIITTPPTETTTIEETIISEIIKETEPIFPYWIFFVIIGLIIVAFIMCLPKVNHKIKFNDVEDPFIVTHKIPLYITTDENANHKVQYVINAYDYETLRNQDLVKIEATYTLIPLPQFYKKIKITSLISSDENEKSEIDIIPSVDNPVIPQDDISLTFNSDVDSMTINFDYYIKPPLKKDNDSEEEEVYDESIDDEDEE